MEKLYVPSAKDIVINREALLNRLANLYAGKKSYEELLKIAKEHVKENFEFCYPDSAPSSKKVGRSPYDKDIVEPFK